MAFAIFFILCITVKQITLAGLAQNIDSSYDLIDYVDKENPVLFTSVAEGAAKAYEVAGAAANVFEKFNAVFKEDSALKIKRLVKMAESLAPMLEAVGPALTAVNLVIQLSGDQESAELKALKVLTEKMDLRFDQLEAQLTEATSKIRRTEILLAYTKQRALFRTLATTYKSYSQKLSPTFKYKLQLECEKCHSSDMFNWLYEFLVQKTAGHDILFDMKSAVNFDRALYNEMLVSFINDAKLSALLQQICSAFILNDPESIAHHTQETARGLKAILNNIRAAEQDFLNSWQPQVTSDIKDWTKDADGKSHPEVAKNVHAKLSKKYSWMYWAVSSYSEVADQDNFNYRTGDNIVFEQRSSEKKLVAQWVSKEMFCSYELLKAEWNEIASYTTWQFAGFNKFKYGAFTPDVADSLRAAIIRHGLAYPLNYKSLIIYKNWLTDEPHTQFDTSAFAKLYIESSGPFWWQKWKTNVIMALACPVYPATSKQ